MSRKFALKRIYQYNALVLAVFLVVFSAGVIFALYRINDANIAKRVDTLSNSVVSDLESKLSSVSFFSAQAFLNGEFQEDLKQLQGPEAQESYDRIYDRFSSMFTTSELIADICYWQYDSQGHFDPDAYMIYGDKIMFILEHMDQFEAFAADSRNNSGKLQTVFGDDRHIAFVRVVNGVLNDNYLKPIGLGVVVVNRYELFSGVDNTSVLGADSCVLDGSGKAVCSMQMGDYFDENGSFVPKNRVSYYTVNWQNWQLVSVYTGKTVFQSFDSVAVAFFITNVAVLLAFFFCMQYVNHVNSRQYYLFIDTFKKVEDGMLDTQMPYGNDEEVNRVARQFNSMLQAISELKGQVTDAQIASLELELEKNAYLVKYLNSQINKHFMFNTFALIRALIHTGKTEQAVQCVDCISQVMRYTLVNKAVVTLEAELNSLSAYLQIQSIRYAGIRLHMDISPDCLDARIPKFILQPIVENCYSHGFQEDEGNIYIHIFQQKGRLIITVRDDGQGVTPEQLSMLRDNLYHDAEQTDTHGIALKNIARRLQIILSDESLLRLDSAPGAGFAVTMELPLEKKEPENV